MKIRRFNENKETYSEEYRFVNDVFTEVVDEYTEFNFYIRDFKPHVSFSYTPKKINTPEENSFDYTEELYKKLVDKTQRESSLLSSIGESIDVIKENDTFKRINIYISEEKFMVVFSKKFGKDVDPNEIFEMTTDIIVHTDILNKYIKSKGFEFTNIELDRTEELGINTINIDIGGDISWDDMVTLSKEMDDDFSSLENPIDYIDFFGNTMTLNINPVHQNEIRIER
jgi:hypothetical protein